jgi:hypothetical protein
VRQHSLHTYRQLLALLTVGPAHPLHLEPLVTNRTGEPWYDQMANARQTLDNVYMVRTAQARVPVPMPLHRCTRGSRNQSTKHADGCTWCT